jgi:pyruvate/2-oxoacid:ferredoxin oxidoreductase alpha subunit
MAGGRMSALSLPIDAGASVEFKPFRARTPLFTVSAGRVLVTLTLPERVSAGDVEFARDLASQAAAYAVEVERLYRSGRRPASGRSSGKGKAA